MLTSEAYSNLSETLDDFIKENGKITKPVKGATLTGNGPKSLMQIKALGNSMTLDPGYCGKNGQTAYVTDGQPTILIENMVCQFLF